jgi:hypothetical protein
MSKNKRSTTHVVIYYKDGSTYNIRRGILLGVFEYRLYIMADKTIDWGDVETPVGGYNTVEIYKETHMIEKKYVDKVEEIDTDGHSEWINF